MKLSLFRKHPSSIRILTRLPIIREERDDHIKYSRTTLVRIHDEVRTVCVFVKASRELSVSDQMLDSLLDTATHEAALRGDWA